MMIIIIVIIMIIVGSGGICRYMLIILEHGFQKDLHPGRDRRQPINQICLKGRTCYRIIEELAKLATHPVGFALAREQIAHPVERLNDAHPRPSSPEELACRRRAKTNGDIAQSQRAASCVGVDNNLGWYGIRQAEVIRRGHAIDQHADLVAAAERLDHGARIWRIGFLRQLVEAGPVIEPAIDPAQLLRRSQSLERLVDSVARAEVEEVRWRPRLAWHIALDPLQDGSFEVGLLVGHVRNL
jgi:hypothetical protein